MRYRPLGKTGLKVSEISFGTYGFSNPALLSAALEAGINLICTCADYQDGRAEEAVGKAIKDIARRDDVILLTGTSVRKGTRKEEILRTIETSLRRLQTDHIEIFKTHNVDDPAQLAVDELFEAFEEAKQAGKALHLGLSGHGRQLPGCLSGAIEDGRFEVVHCRYDFVSYRDTQERLFSQASQQGMGSIVFKISAGERQNEIKDLQAGGLSFTQATVKWALSNPDVTSVSAGITNFDQIKEYCGAVGQQLNRAEKEMLQRYADVMYDQYCRNCGVCEGSCPHRVAVADIMRYSMYFKYYGREKDSMQLYASLPFDRRANRCATCDGQCQGTCPYGRQIREGLIEAHTMLT
jgi:predicted aldo/keto reductase-like oxidoreductase